MIAAAVLIVLAPLLGHGDTEAGSRPVFRARRPAGQSEAIGMAEYRDALKKILALAESGDMEALHDSARALRGARIRHEGVELEPDPTVLGPLADAKNPGAARTAAVRLRALLAELEGAAGPSRVERADPALLERLRAEEAEQDISADGKVGGPGLNPPSSFVEVLRDLVQKLLELMGRFFKWLLRLLFSGSDSLAPGGGVQWMVVALVVLVLAVLGAVAVVALRRSKGLRPVEARSEAPAQSAKDDDPLSRSALEWERFAGELMGAGRFREAIRAWYHAVLVSLFRVGALHYRKDRTNWEYAYALPSGIPWREGFLDATRTFEQEWYGRRNTAVETAESYERRAQAILAELRQGAGR
jgi:hypothetical protein